MAAAHGALLALTASLCVQLLLLLPAAGGLLSEVRVCAFADHLRGSEPQNGPVNELLGVVRENGTVRCSRGSRCYGLWENRGDGKTQLVKQGCWTHIGDQQECQSNRCLVTPTPSQIQNGSYRFCCCNQDLCNTNFTEATPTADIPALRLIKPSGRDEQQTDHRALRLEVTALIALVTVAIAAILIMVLFLAYRMMKGRQKLPLSALDVMEAANFQSVMDLDNLKLLELIGRGRYGTVYRGCLNEHCVAVKLFSSANRQNYNTERSIYCLPLLQQHDNVARFLAADERTTGDGRLEFLILLEYYPYGCLSQYLSVHTVDWSTCCRMTHGVTRGLAFLHTELYRGDQYKPAVAHRDVTSRNVLVQADLSCVLADFGLSMKLTGNCPGHHGDEDITAISEVGAVRYMAPEVLGGALNLRDCEAALKQVDVYALGLLYWESFRRCSDLFPGAAVPEYQLAFQAELGFHPSFEEIQVLVVQEKHRPLFPEAWKENSLVLRSLKETMEDCWDQDAEARLTAQCAEERLSELTLLSVHTTVNNHRNLSPERWPPSSGSASSLLFEDFQVGMVKNIQGEVNITSVSQTNTSRTDGTERNRNSINYERQLAKAQLSSSDSSVSATTVMTPAPILCTTSKSGHSGGTVPNTPVCFQLTEQDLESVKLDPNEKNLPQRPTTLLFLTKTQENTSASSQLKLGKLRSNHREVETGIAKMNTVTIATAAEPRLVTTVTNNISVVGGNYNEGVTTLVTNGMIGGGRTNLAGPLIEEEDSRDGGLVRGEETHLNVLNFSPDEHEPLLRREQSSADREPFHHQKGRGSNSNNNNNRTALGSYVKIQGLECEHQSIIGSEASVVGGISSPKLEQHQETLEISASLASKTTIENKILFSGSVAQATDTNICLQKALVAEPTLGSRNIQSLKAYVVNSDAPGYEGPYSQSTKAQRLLEVQAYRTLASQELEPHPETLVLDLLTREQKSTTEMSDSAAKSEALADYTEPSALKLTASENPHPESLSVKDLETTAFAVVPPPEPSVLQVSVCLQNPHLVLSDEGHTKVRTPKRPCSLDLSLSCISTDDPTATDNSSLSTSGEKIKRRVKTPYTLKKWRPASWALSTDMALDLDLNFSTSDSSRNQTHFSSGLIRARDFGLSQSKSSMAVFLIGKGATATMTSEPDGLTCF